MMNKLLELKSDCSKCRGFCCRALCFFLNDGFPYDKPTGLDCKHLARDYRCQIHERLIIKKLRGCVNYDCLGAGQKTSLINADDKTLFDVFVVMEQLHEILWYLFESVEAVENLSIINQLEEHYQTISKLTYLKPKQLLTLDLSHYRKLVDPLLQKVYHEVNQGIRIEPLEYKLLLNRPDLMARDFRQKNICGQDFKGAFLIKADLSNNNLFGVNFLGSDVRDMNVCNSDLSGSLFLTQAQVNACNGNAKTKLPAYLVKPKYW